MKQLFYILSFCSVLFSSAQEKADTSLFSEDERVAFRKLEGYRQRVLKGESMEALATLYTEDPGSAKTGGAYYGIARGAFVPEFEGAAFALKKPGDLSEVFKTNYGFHFVQLISRSGELIDVRHILIKTSK